MTLYVYLLILVGLLFLLPVLGAPSPSTSKEGGVHTDYYDVIPVMVAHFLYSPKTTLAYNFSGRCYMNFTASFHVDISKKRAVISFNAMNPKNFYCVDHFLLVTQSGTHMKTVFFKGKHTWKVKLKDTELKDVVQNGLYLFNIHESFTHVVDDIYHLIRLFQGKVEYKEAQRFMKEFLGIDLKPRSSAYMIDHSIIRPGDVIMQQSLTGLSTLIGFGTQSPGAGHGAIFVEIDGELWVIESNDDAPFSDLPPTPERRRGISGYPLEEWYRFDGKEAMTVLLPLRDDLSKKFNNTAAVEFFKKHENYPYGYSNFIYSFADTENDSFPGTVSWPLLLSIFKVVEKFAPNEIDLIVMDGARKRTGDYSLKTVDDLTNWLVRNGTMNYGQLIAIPEKDEWIYRGKQQLICSSVVVAMLKAGGVFEPEVAANLDATEFTPKDLYQVKLYKDSWPDKPKECGLGDHPVCQFGPGEFWTPIDHWVHYNSVPPYPGMNTKCPINRTPEMKC